MPKKKRSNQQVERRFHKGDVRTIADDQGIVSGYLTKWGTVDSYGTTFAPGSFSKTFQERGNKVKFLYNHDSLAGKVLDFGEDEIGPYVRVQCNLETQVGRDTYAHVRQGDLDAFSFGFNRMQSRPKDDIIEITEVRLLEVSLVVFPANEDAVVTDFRSEDFNETLDERLTAEKGYKLFSALERTIEDIMWSNSDSDDIISKTDVAIADFHLSYVTWMAKYFAMFERSDDAIKELRNARDSAKNELKNIMKTVDKDMLVRTTSLTQDDIERLQDGNLMSIQSRNKLNELPEEIQQCHQLRRREVVSTLCDELRGSGFSSIESLRFKNLLGIAEKREDNKKEGQILIDAISKWEL